LNLVKNIYSKKIYFALDFGAERVAAIVAERESPEGFRVLGAGDARAEGLADGGITHLGDAVEAVVEAVGKAERSSGLRAETLYYNFDDPGMESRFAEGSKTLAGEGEIGPADVDDARQMAERMAGHFEKNIVYSRETRFLIDERDAVEDPVGAFGRHLHATVHLLQARSAHCQDWQKLMRRAKIDKAVRVVSPWSTAYGVVPPREREGRKLIADLGGDLVSVFLFENGRVSACSFFAPGRSTAGETAERALSAATALAAKSHGPEEVLLTGDRAEEPVFLEVFKRGPLASRVAPALGIPKLNAPRYASIAGLVSVAEELEKKIPMLHNRRGLLLDVKERAVTFINEYF
jgi:cell division protein FtsA